MVKGVGLLFKYELVYSLLLHMLMPKILIECAVAEIKCCQRPATLRGYSISNCVGKT